MEGNENNSGFRRRALFARTYLFFFFFLFCLPNCFTQEKRSLWQSVTTVMPSLVVRQGGVDLELLATSDGQVSARLDTTQLDVIAVLLTHQRTPAAACALAVSARGG